MITIILTALVLFSVLMFITTGYQHNRATELEAEVAHIFDRLEALEKKPDGDVPGMTDSIIRLTQARVDKVGDSGRFTVTAMGEVPIRVKTISSATMNQEFQCTAVVMFSGQTIFVTEEPMEVARKMGMNLPDPSDFSKDFSKILRGENHPKSS